MATFPNMGLTEPTRGPSGAGVWGDTQDDNTQKIDDHDHSPGKGKRINTDGISIDADLTFGGLYAPIGLHRITFASIVATTVTQNRSFFVSAADNELYFRNNVGTNIKITNGNSLNVAAFTGGFTGDVSQMSASYDAATTGFRFRTSANNWARGSFGGVRLLELGTSETVFIEHVAPAALAVSYTVTWPLAPPGTTSLLQMSSGGVVTASNTATNVTLAGTTTTTGTVTLGAGATASAGQTISSPYFLATTDYRHAWTTQDTFIVGRQVVNFAAGANLTNENTQLALGTSTLPMTLAAVPLKRGYIQQFSVTYNKVSGAGSVTIALKTVGGAVVGTATISGSPGPGAAVFTPATPTSWPTSSTWYVLVSGGGTTGDIITGMSADISNPVP